MNIPDDHRCAWATAGTRGMRCMCPATLSTSKFCVFHRHPESVDVHGIVEWSQDATAEEYLARVKAFLYPSDPPEIRALRARMEAHRSGKPVGILSSRLLPDRQPGDDEEIAA